MVFGAVDKSKTLRLLMPILIMTVLGACIRVVVYGLNESGYGQKIEPEIIETINNYHDNIPVETDEETGGNLEELKNLFQSVVKEWATNIKGNKSVLIYDLDNEEFLAAYNQDGYYNTASLYKLFVVYEGYRQIEDGVWDQNSQAGSTGYSVLQCLDLAIRESNSPCAETLWGMVGHDELDRIIVEEYGITQSDISGLTSNPKDILKMMILFYKHPNITNKDLLTVMWDSFLNQPITTDNWRQGLPSGFSDKVEVYNKVGWLFNGTNWSIYHDAAILNFSEKNRHFAIVVMTNSVWPNQISSLGAQIESAFYEYIQ